MKLKKYETMFILLPTLTNDDVNKFVKTIEKLVKDNNGNMIEKVKQEKRNLTYPIKKQNSGYYLIFNYEVPTNFNKILLETFKYDEKILRYMPIVKE
jgi:small subunit ribosomal protein S6